MLCPLMTAGVLSANDGILALETTGGEGVDCLKEKCSWWDHDFIKCTILTIGKELTLIRQHLNEKDE